LPPTKILTVFSTPAVGTAVNVVLPDAANCTCAMPIALRAWATTPDTPLPDTRIVQIPGSGRLTITMRSARKLENSVTSSPPASWPDGRRTWAT